MAVLDLAIPFAASVVGGVAVALVNHFMTKRRDNEKKLAELRVDHLIECWRKVERAALIGSRTGTASAEEAYDGIDDAVARIILLGTKREIEICDSFAVELSKGNSSGVVELLNELRDSLRRELGLESVPKLANVFFRIRRD